MSDLSKMPEFGALLMECIRQYPRQYPDVALVAEKARALLAALDREKEAKPEPPKPAERTAEGVLVELDTHICDYITGKTHYVVTATMASLVAEALRLVTELRAERDEWEKAYAEAMRRGDRLRAERDALRKDITMIQAGYAECSAGRDALRAERDELSSKNLVLRVRIADAQQYLARTTITNQALHVASEVGRILRGDK